MALLVTSRTTALKLIFLFIITPLIIAANLQLMGDIGTRDSIAYWAAAQVFLNNGNPYDGYLLLKAQQTIAPYRDTAHFFLNPPWTLLPLLVIGSGSFAIFSFIILTLNISCSFFALWRLANIFGPLPPRYLFIVGCFFPMVSSWYFGQLSFCLILGSVLTLEWVVDNYKPYWKALAALALFSVKPQAYYLIVVAILVIAQRTFSRSDLAKMGVCVAPFVAFLIYRNDLITYWIESFKVSSNWATSSVPSWLYAYFPSLNRPFILAGLSLVIAFVSLAVFRKGVTPYQLVWCLIISSLTAPYAWVFDFSPLVIVVYLVMLVIVARPGGQPVRLVSLCTLALLCLPFEDLYSIDLRYYILHPLLVTAILFLNRRDVSQLIEQRAKPSRH